MEKVLSQKETTSDELVPRLMSTIPIILERYLTEVPKHHAKLLLNIPQQTALFHNNCMYLAYWLNVNTSKGIESAVTIVKSLHHCGSEQFLRQINNQRGQLMEILKDFGKLFINSVFMRMFSIKISLLQILAKVHPNSIRSRQRLFVNVCVNWSY